MKTLHAGKQFNTVFSKGKRLTGKYLRAVFLLDLGREPVISVVAPKKLGGAVLRNRYKRLMREALRRLEVSQGLLGIFIAKPSFSEAGVDEIEKDMKDLINKAEVKL